MIHQCLSDILNLKRLPLGELGFFYGGLSGKSKEDFEDGNGRFVPYMNVFSNFSVDINNLGEVNIEEDEHQNKIEYGDVLFTGSSETPDECGMSSVMLDKVEDDSPIYLNSFCFGFRFNDLSQIYPAFYKHLFRSNKIRKEIGKTANGVTRFNITKKLFAKILIPLPSLEQQKEIAAKLDIYTSLISRLDEEILLRKKQLEYHQEKYLHIKNDEVLSWLSFGEDFVLKARIGWQGLTRKEYRDEGSYKLITGTDFTSDNRIDFEHCVYVDKERYDQDPNIQIHEDDVLITKDGTLGKIAYIDKLDMPATLNGGIFVVRDKEKRVLQKFLMYYLTSSIFVNWMKRNHTQGSIQHLTQALLSKFTIPVIAKEKQRDIVNKLDTFTSLISKLQEERDLRQKQYEYYREKLLTFE